MNQPDYEDRRRAELADNRTLRRGRRRFFIVAGLGAAAFVDAVASGTLGFVVGKSSGCDDSALQAKNNRLQVDNDVLSTQIGGSRATQEACVDAYSAAYNESQALVGQLQQENAVLRDQLAQLTNVTPNPTATPAPTETQTVCQPSRVDDFLAANNLNFDQASVVKDSCKIALVWEFYCPTPTQMPTTGTNKGHQPPGSPNNPGHSPIQPQP